MEAWEYCSVIIETGRLGVVNLKRTVYISFHTPDKTLEEKREFEGPNSKAATANILGQVFAQLGEDGWELVSTGTIPDDGAYFLKRLVVNADEAP